MTLTNQGGVVFRAGEGLWFVPATIAQKVIAVPAVARVPGAPRELRGVALVDGDMIAILEASPDGGSAMLVCAIAGEHVGLVGIEIVATGKFPIHVGHEGEVRFEAEIAHAFDVASLIAKVRGSRWGVTLPE